MTCSACGGPLPPRRGRKPPIYCSVTCRRAREYALRRVQRRLQRAEEAAARWARDAVTTPGALTVYGDTCAERAVAARAEVTDLEARLRALLTDSKETTS